LEADEGRGFDAVDLQLAVESRRECCATTSERRFVLLSPPPSFD